VETLGIPVKKRETVLTVSQKDVVYIKKYLAGKGANPSDLLITIAPCALYHWRSWRPERFARVALNIASKYNGKVILVGSSSDRNVLERIKALTDQKGINIIFDLTLSQVAALISRSSVFIGNDSGLIHIAAAVKTPMIQLFGPGEPQKFGYTDNNNSLLIKTSCPDHPCVQRVCKYQKNWCLDQISVEDVMNAFHKIASQTFLQEGSEILED